MGADKRHGGIQMELKITESGQHIEIKAAVNNNNEHEEGVINVKKLTPPPKWRALLESIIEKSFLLSASISILSLVLITLFILMNGLPAIKEIGLTDFVFGTKWDPMAKEFGILAMIVGSIYVTIGAIVIGCPIGVLTAVFISEVAPKQVVAFVKPAIELLAGLPSVIYGFFGLVVVIPIIDDVLGGGGNSLLAAMIILGIMILPTIIAISETSIRSVPNEYRENSLALGATKLQTIFGVVLPAAKSGVYTSILLGVGRAIGETMAVILVAGNTVQMPTSLLDRFRPLTANIAIEMSYAEGLHMQSLFATGVVLFIFIMALNLAVNLLVRRKAA